MTDSSRTRVLVTGAGGPAGVAVIRSLLARDDVDVFAADMDGYLAGLTRDSETSSISQARPSAAFGRPTPARCCREPLRRRRR